LIKRNTVLLALSQLPGVYAVGEITELYGASLAFCSVRACAGRPGLIGVG
jgi:hypothetical protein